MRAWYSLLLIQPFYISWKSPDQDHHILPVHFSNHSHVCFVLSAFYFLLPSVFYAKLDTAGTSWGKKDASIFTYPTKNSIRERQNILFQMNDDTNRCFSASLLLKFVLVGKRAICICMQCGKFIFIAGRAKADAVSSQPHQFLTKQFVILMHHAKYVDRHFYISENWKKLIVGLKMWKSPVGLAEQSKRWCSRALHCFENV